MTNNRVIIGLSGVAGSGKDLLFTKLSSIFNAQRFALADELKREINPFLIEKFGCDIFTCPREMKDIVRPLLVAHGKVRRDTSEGRYWTDKLTKAINESDAKFVVVTDIRYDSFKVDEVDWLKKVMCGKLVHVTKYHFDESGKRVTVEPPNEDERINDPKVRLKSDFLFEWPDFKKHPNMLDATHKEVERLADWIESNCRK